MRFLHWYIWGRLSMRSSYWLLGPVCLCVCDRDTQAFTQLCRDSSPDVWKFLLPPVRRWSGFLVFSHRPCLSSHHLCENIERTSSSFYTALELFWWVRCVRISVFLLLFEQFLEGAPEASFVLLPTPLCEGGVMVLLCPSPPFWLLPPWLEPAFLVWRPNRRSFPRS